MKLIGAVNYMNDSLAKHKGKQPDRGHLIHRKDERPTNNQNAPEPPQPLPADRESNIGHLIDTSA